MASGMIATVNRNILRKSMLEVSRWKAEAEADGWEAKESVTRPSREVCSDLCSHV